MLLPFAQASAHELRADLEGVADALEGEQHAAVPRLEPLLRLLEQLACNGSARAGIALVADDGVLEDREHEETLALPGTSIAHASVELAGEHHLRRDTAARGGPDGGSGFDVELDHGASCDWFCPRDGVRSSWSVATPIPRMAPRPACRTSSAGRTALLRRTSMVPGGQGPPRGASFRSCPMLASAPKLSASTTRQTKRRGKSSRYA